jgi:aldehyde dehydrogenase (NAD+)/betaine-aldehyde dehydrogenase
VSALRGHRLLIDGELIEGAGEPLTLIDPATEKPYTTVETASLEQLDAAVHAARAAFRDGRWSELAPERRSSLLHDACRVLSEHRDELTELVVTEVGCPVSTTREHQVAAPIELLGWYAEAARRVHDRLLEPRLGGRRSSSLVRYAPVGVVGAVTAYNYPLTLALNKLGAALATGNTVVMMPSVRAPTSTLRVGELLRESGIPDGVVGIVVGDAAIGRALTEHPDVDLVAFTGSVEIGALVMAQAARTVKHVVLELGGKSPAVLLPGTDLDSHLHPLHQRWTRHAGQGCQCPTRHFVHVSQWDDYVERSRQIMASFAVGDPRDERTEIGPVVSEGQRDRIHAYVEEALAAGAEILASTPVPKVTRGFWSQPLLIGSVDHSARISQEEVFGPVAVAFPYHDTDEAIDLANATKYGLAAYVYGPDVNECRRVASRIRAGNVAINGVGGVRPDAPNGGMKQSGVGRMRGDEGLREFMETQHIQWPI